jgi:hypothetical protein
MLSPLAALGAEHDDPVAFRQDIVNPDSKRAVRQFHELSEESQHFRMAAVVARQRTARAGPANNNRCSSSVASAQYRSKSWRTRPSAKSRSRSEPRARNTKRRCRLAKAHAASSIAVLPSPALPSTTMTPPRRINVRISVSSDLRSRRLIMRAIIVYADHAVQCPLRPDHPGFSPEEVTGN